MRGLWLVGLLLWAAAVQASPTWDSLWRTSDQRAQQLLHQGKPAEASRLFRDPRRKAYAELQAGNFQQAAQDFNAFNDSDGQYNRGNALARAGRLQEAIRAYDAALARDLVQLAVVRIRVDAPEARAADVGNAWAEPVAEQAEQAEHDVGVGTSVGHDLGRLQLGLLFQHNRQQH